MEEKIEVGDYIRTNTGYIAKVLEVQQGKDRYLIDNNRFSITKPYIKKHRKNIIDLIEVDDYVNGSKVLEIEKYEDGTTFYITTEVCEDLMKAVSDFEIADILTHEQYKKYCYRLEG